MSIVTKESNPKLYNALFPEDEAKKILEKIKSVSDFDDYVDFKGTEFKPLLDGIINLQECCKDKIDKYQDMILKYCKLQEKYKKSCETYQQALDETMSEKMNLEKENEDLREDNYAYHQLMKMQNKREFRSKFLKEFQEEFGTNTFPDYDEIYKRYDKIKKENERLIRGTTVLTNKIIDMNKENKDYKSRCEKTYNYLDKFIPNEYGVLLTERQWKYVKKILGGDDNE